MDNQSINNHDVIKLPESEFHDADNDFPFSDASNSFDSDSGDDSTVSVISDHSPDSPSSPSSAGLRNRRRSSKDSTQSQFFINNPDGLRDFNPAVKSNGKLKSNKVNGETDDSSAVTSERISDGEEESVNSPSNLLYILVELLFRVIGYQTKFLASSVTFPVLLMRFSYLLVTEPNGIIKLGRDYIFGNVYDIWGICCSFFKLVRYIYDGNHEAAWKLCFRVGKGLLWLFYCGVVCVALIIPAFLVSGMVTKWVVEEPLQVTEQLTFDYTRDTPMAFVPIVSCSESLSLEHGKVSNVGKFFEPQVVPFGHELQATVFLTLPESDYNRNLGIFQVRVDFLSDAGKLLASIRQPCMLQFKSQTIHLLSTFLKLASLLTGYSSETQTLDIRFSGYSEKDVHTSCTRVVIEQRAEFARGGGVPEIYSASLKLESQLPFLKRMMWYSKGLIYTWIAFMIFMMELLLTLLCCIPIIFPRVRHMGSSLNNNASRNTSF
uniref:seipin-2-like n=1 Tax=Erigeron canadensis TaxID=72917 RepID=UPI001CB8CDA9|nr:seipin-2-like [Erigeron canadensis]